MKTLGRSLQIIGLVLLPLAMMMEVTGTLDRLTGVSDMVMMLIAGAAAFYIGRIVEGYART